MIKLSEKTRKKPTVRILMKLTRGDKTVSRYHSSRKRRILHLIKANNFAKAYLKVDYGKGDYNDGIYESKEELLLALSAFTENALVAAL